MLISSIHEILTPYSKFAAIFVVHLSGRLD